MSNPTPSAERPADPPSQPQTTSTSGGRGRGSATTSNPVPKLPTIRWDDKDSRECTARLIEWCKSNPKICQKLFSDSHQAASKEGRRRQVMSSQKDTYYAYVAQAVFKSDHNPSIQQLYHQHPNMFVKPIKARFQS